MRYIKSIGDRHIVGGKNLSFSRCTDDLVHVFVDVVSPTEGPQVSYCGSLHQIEGMERPSETDGLCPACDRFIGTLLRKDVN